jgi:hypothetical protein
MLKIFFMEDCMASAAEIARRRNELLIRELQGKTPEQQKVVRYFLAPDGCLSFKMKDEEYEALVQARWANINFKQKALDKIGLDESQVNEIPPVHFEGYRLLDRDKDKIAGWARRGKDGVWRGSIYEISWVFFTDTQVYLYQYWFEMSADRKGESTQEYFYKDITSFSTSSDTGEWKISGEDGPGQTVETHRFTVIVPGDKFFCSMSNLQDQDSLDEKIQAMKQKLREKKG